MHALFMSYRTVLCTSLFIMFCPNVTAQVMLFRIHAGQRLLCTRQAVWHVHVCLEELAGYEVRQGAALGHIQLIQWLSLSNFLCDCAIFCNSAINRFFATLNEMFRYFVLLFLLEEGPNNWSSCCTSVDKDKEVKMDECLL